MSKFGTPNERAEALQVVPDEITDLVSSDVVGEALVVGPRVGDGVE